MVGRVRHWGVWLLAGLIVLSLHAMALTVLLTNWQPVTPAADAAPMTVTLAMQATSSSEHSQQASKPEVAPPPPEPEAIPEPVVTPTPKPVVKPKPKPVVKPKPKPKPKPVVKPKPKPVTTPKPEKKPLPPQQKKQHLDATKAKQTQARRQGSSEQLAAAKQRWYGKVLALLQSHKRYPRLALLRGQQGTVKVRFVVDRVGKVLSVKLINSSGHHALDREALSLLKRVSPLPPPPADVTGNQVRIEVPIAFELTH